VLAAFRAKGWLLTAAELGEVTRSVQAHVAEFIGHCGGLGTPAPPAEAAPAAEEEAAGEEEAAAEDEAPAEVDAAEAEAEADAEAAAAEEEQPAEADHGPTAAMLAFAIVPSSSAAAGSTWTAIEKALTVSGSECQGGPDGPSLAYPVSAHRNRPWGTSWSDTQKQDIVLLAVHTRALVQIYDRVLRGLTSALGLPDN